MPKDRFKIIEERLKAYNAIEEKHVKAVLDATEQAYSRIENILAQDITEYQRWQYGVRIEQVDDLYEDYKVLLANTQKDLTVDGATLGIEKTLETASSLSNDAVYVSETYIASLEPMINTDVIADTSRRVFDYMDGKLVQSKTLLMDQAITVKLELQQAIIDGKGTHEIVERALSVIDGDYKTMYAATKRHVHHTLSEVYCESSNQTIMGMAQTDLELFSMWMSYMDGETTIPCKDLNGQVVRPGQDFIHGSWRGQRPPPVGDNVNPSWHHCRSDIIPWKPDYPSMGVMPYSRYPDIQEIINRGGM